MSTQHHHVILSPRPDKIDEARDLLIQCEAQIVNMYSQNGPMSWFSSYDADAGCFVINALFADDTAVKFHQNNIQPLVEKMGQLLAAPPQTVISMVFAKTTMAAA